MRALPCRAEAASPRAGMIAPEPFALERSLALLEQRLEHVVARDEQREAPHGEVRNVAGVLAQELAHGLDRSQDAVTRSRSGCSSGAAGTSR